MNKDHHTVNHTKKDNDDLSPDIFPSNYLAEVVRSLEGFDKKLEYLVKSHVRFVTDQPVCRRKC